ncbi:MAG: pilus assembly protein PilP [Bdellovibrio sp.]
MGIRLFLSFVARQLIVGGVIWSTSSAQTSAGEVGDRTVSPKSGPVLTSEISSKAEPLDSQPDSSVPRVPIGDFFYEPEGRRDPFKSIFSDTDISTGANDSLVQTDILEAYDLNQLHLTAVLWNVDDPKALVRSPTGKLFMVRSKQRTRIGRNKGYVAAIREGEVVVFEFSQDGKTPTTRVLYLKN